MGERLLCKQEVDGSIPFTSTSAAGARRRPKGRGGDREKSNCRFAGILRIAGGAGGVFEM